MGGITVSEKKLLEEFLGNARYHIELSEAIHNTSIEELEKKINDLQDIILYGPPGTGKSYMVDTVLEKIKEKIGLTKTVQFHAEYTYDDFIEGLKPVEGQAGTFKYEKGSFFEFCINARRMDSDKINLFFIDEINRANITAVFGEVMYAMEDKGKRTLKTARTNEDFCIPSNVIIVGTMNTADRSLAKQFDFALRRRFKFLPVYPNANILRELIYLKGFSPDLKQDFNEDMYIKAFEIMNELITRHPLLGKELTIGHILWVPSVKEEEYINKTHIGDTFREIVLPQISSYCGPNEEALETIVGPDLKKSIIFGKYPSDDSIIAYLKTLNNIYK